MDALTSFDTLELPDPVKQALEALNITIPTPIQAEAIPHAMVGKDIVGLAQTGTGKTLAFCLPLVTALDKEENKDACALVLAPTREIAIQVTEVLKQLTAKMTGRWHPVLVIGGVGMQPQIEGLGKQPRFIVATPGRLVDHMREGHAKLADVSYLVLDEADRMLDMGFAPQLNEVLRGLPAARQTMLFSATFPEEIADISRKYLKDPVRVEVGPGHSRPVDSVTQVVKEMEEDNKFDSLLEALKERAGTIIVFVRTKHRTERLAKQLEKAGHSAGRIHGDRSQSQRQNTLKAFKEGEIRILVATDIAARGIDVPDVAHIINYDIPDVPEEYIHRIGRSGRAGATGEALTFVTPHVREEWRAIVKLIDPELYAKTPKVANVPRPDKPQQQGRHGGHRQQSGERQQSAAPQGQHQGGQNRGQQARPNRDQNRGQQGQGQGAGPRREREPFDRDGRGNRGGGQQFRGPRDEGHGNRDGGQRDDNYGNRAPQAAPEEVVEDSFLDDNVPQPSLEEQLHRIDRPERGNRNRGPRSGGSGGGGANRGGSRGGAGGSNAGGERSHRKWEAPKKHPYARGGGSGSSGGNSGGGGNGGQAASSPPREDSDDNSGNRPGAGGEDKKKGFFDWWKK